MEMETRASVENQSLVQFPVGATVIYGLLGHCTVVAIETKNVGGNSISFYKLEVQKSNLSRSQRHEPAVWIPMDSAKSRGLRSAMNAEAAAQAMSFLMSREYFFSLQDPWSTVHPKLENVIRSEGGAGLAKVASYLAVLKRRQIVSPPEVNRFYEGVLKLLLRELSSVLGETHKTLEEKIQRGVRQKLILDQ